MPQNPEEKKDEENTFIREYIKDRPRSRRQLLLSVLTALLLGVVFGGAAVVTWHLGTSVLSSGDTASADEELSAESADAQEIEKQEDTDTAQADTAADEAEESDEPDLSDYQKLKYEIYAIGRSADKSIVTVSATSQGTDLFQSDYESTDQVMGLVLFIDSEILILTQYEPLSDAAGIYVEFSDDTQADAQITGYDANIGLAVISVDASSLPTSVVNSITAAELKTSGYVSQGQIVIAIGAPLGTVNSILDGTITSNSNEITVEDGIYTIFTTSMSGTQDSSGVLINTDGEVIGIMMMEYNSQNSPDTLTAVSVKELWPLIEKLMNGEAVAYMGVTIADVTQSMSEEYGLPVGVYIREVADDSPAYEAGIQPGDIITMIGAEEIEDADDFMDYLLLCKPDQTVNVTVMRASGDEYAEVSCSVKLSRK